MNVKNNLSILLQIAKTKNQPSNRIIVKANSEKLAKGQIRRSEKVT